MSKYGIGNKKSFVRSKRDFYATPYESILYLLPHIKGKTKFCEPMAGNGAIIDHLGKHNIKCNYKMDIEPQRDDIMVGDASKKFDADFVISNPPYSKPLLEPILKNLITNIKESWLLLPGDNAHNKYFGKYMDYCSKVVSVGRVRWFPGTKMASTDNFAWYLFINKKSPTIFYGRYLNETTQGL